MVSLKEDLEKAGWYLSDEGLSICEDHIQQKPSAKEIIKCALNLDLKEIGDKALPEDLQKGKIKEFRGPCVLQVTKTRNVAAPKANEKSSVAPRLLQVHLTDGHRTCVAVEHGPFQNKLSLETPPGSKLCINGCAEVRNGFLLLDGEKVNVLGGKVESIYNKWLVTKDAGGFSRTVTDVDEAPPPFVPFGTTISHKYSTNKPALQKSSAKQGKDDDDNKEFSEQRHAAIAEVKKSLTDSTRKTFLGGKNRPNTESNTVSSNNFPRKSQLEPQHNNQAVFRKPGAVKVDENSCNKIIQMGFPRAEATEALRQFENNVERAVEHLIGPNNNNNKESLSSVASRPMRNDNNRGRRNDRGRGRGRPSRSRDDGGNDSQHHSTSATLFDFLETKIAPSSKNISKPPSDTPSTSKQYNDVNGVMDDEALQEQSIIEYVKELSLVETRGSSTDRQTRRVQESPTRSENPENAGVAKYRGQPNSERFTKEKYDGIKSYEATSSRNRPSSDRRRDNNTYDRQDAGDDFHGSRDNYSQRHDGQVNRGGRKRGGGGRREYNNDRRNERFDNDFFENNDTQERGGDRRPRRGVSDNFSGDNRNEFGQSSRRQDTRRPPHDRQNELPPRFRRKQMQEGRQPPTPSNNQSFQREDATPSSTHKKGLTLGDTARQLNSASNVNSDFSKPSYPVYDNENSSTRQKPSPSHSYQDQRQHNRNHNPDNASFQHIPYQGYVRWKPGMKCQARYWEDRQFYDATVEDVHQTEPTAVVLFTEYGNAEEVLFQDMRPLKTKSSLSSADCGSYNGPTGGLEFTRGHKGPTRYPNEEREGRRNARPSRSLYQPPKGK